MKHFTFNCKNDNDMSLLDVCMNQLKNKNISYTASYKYSDKGSPIIVISAIAVRK